LMRYIGITASITAICLMLACHRKMPLEKTNEPNFKLVPATGSKLLLIKKNDATIAVNPTTTFTPNSKVNDNDTLLLEGELINTPNFNLRKPNFVIIHHTAQNSCAETYRTFSLSRTQRSSHYVICRDGNVTQLVSYYLRAWHAGPSKWGNLTDLNSTSIGIELDNNGHEPYEKAQINSLLLLLDTLKHRFNIPTTNFIGHCDIAPLRKDDPSVFFPWKLLAQKGFGVWYDEPLQPDSTDNIGDLQALKIIGYDVKDSSAAIRAFKRHFRQESGSVLTQEDRLALKCLYKKYM
jgi:N-acetylmuramoyl-L-alanine amidase